MTTTDDLARQMTEGYSLVERAVHLGLDGQTIAIRSNSDALLNQLRGYFAHVVCDAPADITVVAIERPILDLGLDFIDWRREPGKTGRKDAYIDIEDARAILKVRTGMVFLQSEAYRIAAGPCLANDNQVINFINAQYMNHLQNQGDLICHASALVSGGQGLAIAGLSGGGKSTLMLRLMDEPGIKFLTNDRLFLRDEQDGIVARGIPKLPRINPGTILNNPKLTNVLPTGRRRELEVLSREELWVLEEKYDVDVVKTYGAQALTERTKLTGLLVLNWDRQNSQLPNLNRINLVKRDDVLKAVMKSPGPFYQFPDRHFLSDDLPLDPGPYLTLLADVPVYEVSGGIDFDAVAGLVTRCIMNARC